MKEWKEREILYEKHYGTRLFLTHSFHWEKYVLVSKMQCCKGANASMCCM